MILPRFSQPRQPLFDHNSYKPPKIDLPRFNGEDVVGWLAMAERYLRTYRVPLHECVSTLASHFRPDASVWMNAYKIRHPSPTWAEFVTALLGHFGSGSNSDFKAALSHLQHTSTVDDFITAFTKLSCRAPDWSDDQLLPIFCGGLKTEIRHDVMALEPRSLAEAQRLARRYEAKLADIRQSHFQRPSPSHYTPRNHFPNNSPTSTPSLQGPPPLPFTSTRQPNPPIPQTNSTKPSQFCRLSPLEQRERRAKGLCFNCDEHYSDTHVCKKPFMAILDHHPPVEDPQQILLNLLKWKKTLQTTHIFTPFMP